MAPIQPTREEISDAFAFADDYEIIDQGVWGRYLVVVVERKASSSDGPERSAGPHTSVPSQEASAGPRSCHLE